MTYFDKIKRRFGLLDDSLLCKVLLRVKSVFRCKGRRRDNLKHLPNCLLTRQEFVFDNINSDLAEFGRVSFVNVSHYCLVVVKILALCETRVLVNGKRFTQVEV